MTQTVKTNQEQTLRHPQERVEERGSALVYVLIAIALFAALSFTLGRQTDTGEANQIEENRVELYATQIISTASQVKSIVDQMLFTGADIENLVFEMPSDANFETGPFINKVFHPQGGGLNRPRLPSEAVAITSSDPTPGWYLGRFNNVDWTALGPGNTAAAGGLEAPYEDVILVAYGIDEAVCANINEKITGSNVIPTMTDSIKNVMIDESLHTGTNVELTTGTGNICVQCEEMASLCVENAAQDAYGFYSIIADQ